MDTSKLVEQLVQSLRELERDHVIRIKGMKFDSSLDNPHFSPTVGFYNLEIICSDKFADMINKELKKE